jgi:hypothetical protein
MFPKQDRYNWLSHYELRLEGMWRPVMPEDVIKLAWPVPDPMAPWRPLSPLESIGREIGMDDATIQMMASVVGNDGIPFTAVSLPPGSTLTDPVKKAMKDDYRTAQRSRAELAILEGGATFERPGLDFSELQIEKLSRLPESRIAAAFHVSPIMAGLMIGLEHTKYSNMSEAREMLAEGTMLPLWRLWESAWNHSLQRDFGSRSLRRQRLRYAYDVNKVVSLQESIRKRHNSVRQDYLSGVRTLNETRAELGLPSDPEGAKYVPHSTGGGITINAGGPPAPENKPLPDAPSKPSPVERPALNGYVSKNGNITASNGQNN